MLYFGFFLVRSDFLKFERSPFTIQHRNAREDFDDSEDHGGKNFKLQLSALFVRLEIKTRVRHQRESNLQIHQ
jgi:hypothetical protein